MRRESDRQEPAPADEVLGFLANTVHDIRTPANSLYGFLELLEEQIEDARLQQFVRNAKESAQFINELTTSILDRIALQQGQSREPETINPIKFFSDIATVFSANMYDKRIDYNIFLDPALPAEIRLDAFRLKRVILNLLGNAWKFTPRGKSITFSVEYLPESRRMRIAVADTGIGIAKEKQEKIFEAFQQAEESTAAEYGGTGLGLSISAQYVAELGGSLRLESELEKGSRFFFELPVELVEESSRFPVLAVVPSRVDILLGKQHAVPARNILKYLRRLGVGQERVRGIPSLKKLDASTTHLIAFGSLITPEEIEALRQRGVSVLVIEEELFSLAGDPRYEHLEVVSAYTFYLPELYAFLAEGGHAGNRARRALVVDDNRINIELLRTQLEGELYHVDAVESGEEALRLLERSLEEGSPYSLALVDRHLPDLGGIELMERFRAEERKRGGTPLFAVSITGDPHADPRENELFDRIMRKPFKRQEFKAILAELEKR
jgi:CheY-like chemotaxis protein